MEDIVSKLKSYSACDISDALLKLKVPGAGFIPDLNLYSGLSSTSPVTPPRSSVTIAPISTVLFAPKSSTPDDSYPEANISKDVHWADLTQPGTIVLLKQPHGQKNAICGGIMALRMSVLQAKGIVVAGRVRDVEELRATGLPIWGKGTSAVGAGGGSVPWAIQVPLEIDGVTVEPGDLAFCDAVNGVVVIPHNKVMQVLELLPKLVSADDKAKEDVAKGASVFEAFKKHRSNLSAPGVKQ